MNYRNTNIYKRSLELVQTSHAVIRDLPPGYGFLADQLRRASASVALNFAEGCGKPSSAERRRFFHIARGSAYEVAAVVDVASSLGAIDSAQAEHMLDLADHLCAMLTRFSRASASVGRQRSAVSRWPSGSNTSWRHGLTCDPSGGWNSIRRLIRAQCFESLKALSLGMRG